MLKVESISKSFRGLKAVSKASFEVEKGALVALIGPNGAGKTTCFNMIAGVFSPDSGKIVFEEKEIQKDNIAYCGQDFRFTNISNRYF